jgi:carbonic anhydrase/acetyltransferase-like protein (isoleucine patch superfamily)
LVTIAEDAEIGNFVYVLPRTQSLNDPFPPSSIRRGIKIGDMSVISAGCLLYPGAEIGMGCFVAGGSHVKLKISDLSCVAGVPAKEFATLDKYIHPEFGPFHPWIKRFIDKYPKESHADIERTIEEINSRLQRLRTS